VVRLLVDRGAVVTSREVQVAEASGVGAVADLLRRAVCEGRGGRDRRNWGWGMLECCDGTGEGR
jgi:hypothetical protein